MTTENKSTKNDKPKKPARPRLKRLPSVEIRYVDHDENQEELNAWDICRPVCVLAQETAPKNPWRWGWAIIEPPKHPQTLVLALTRPITPGNDHYGLTLCFVDCQSETDKVKGRKALKRKVEQWRKEHNLRAEAPSE
jgi:hypothetical protein